MRLGLLGSTGVCVALGVAMYGCPGGTAGSAESGSDYNSGGGRPAPSGVPAPGSHELEVLGDHWRELRFGVRDLLLVRLIDTESREPVAGARVSFALVGRSQDSSLDQVDVMTDAEGIAENALTAGQVAAAFTVRVTAPGADEKLIEIGVSNSGFGTLLVEAPYAGRRAVAQRIVFAQAGMDCEDAERMPGDPRATLSTTTDTARFAALPADVSYALLAIAEGKDGEQVARGCVDEVVVRRDRQVTAVVWFVDQALELSESFTLDATFRARAPAQTLADTVRDAAEMLVKTDAMGEIESDRADARFLLDSLEETLTTEAYGGEPGAAELAEALSAARQAAGEDSPDATLDEALAGGDLGALRTAVPSLTSFVRERLEQLRLLAVVNVAEQDGEAVSLSWQPQSLTTVPEDGSAALQVDLAQDAVASQAQLLRTQDTITLEQVSFSVPFGTLATKVLHRVVSLDETGPGHADEIREAIGCDTLQDWLAEQNYAQDGGCDESCVRAACDRAMTRLVSASETALSELDTVRPTLTVLGDLELGDDDGDLQCDWLSSEDFLAMWEAEDLARPGDPLSGTASAMPVGGPTE